jgi:hypothetical protein
MSRYCFLPFLFSVIIIAESIAGIPGYFFSLKAGFTAPTDYTIVDTFSDGYFTEAEFGIKNPYYSLGASLTRLNYSDDSYINIFDRSQDNKLAIYNLSLRLRGEFIPGSTDLSLFVLTGAGFYKANWRKKIFDRSGPDSRLEESTADFYGWSFEFAIGFEIPVAGGISIRSTLDFSHLPADFREYFHGITNIDGITGEFSGFHDYKSVNLGSRRLGIGAVYEFDL